MRPEATSAQETVHGAQKEYEELGVPAEWVEHLQKLGYTTIDKLKEVEDVLPKCYFGKTSRAAYAPACG